MMRGLKTMLTGIDNETVDAGRVLWLVMGLGYVFLASWAVVHGAAWDPINYGTGAAALLGGGGGALLLKAKTEPAQA